MNEINTASATLLNRITGGFRRVGIGKIDTVLATKIVNIVCKHSKVLPNEIYAGTRGVSVVADARHVIIWILRVEFGYKLMAIADFMGRDHTTINHAVKRVTTEIRGSDKRSVRFAEYIDLILKEVANG